MNQTKTHTFILCMAVGTVILLTSGCVNQATAKLTSGADLTKIHKNRVSRGLRTVYGVD